MTTPKAPVAILECMKDHEQALASLYELYAGKFTEYQEFWRELSIEEIQHAKWIDHLQVNDSSEDFIVERFKIGAIQHSTEYVKNLEDAANQPDFELINALSTALQLEEALMENKYFEIIETDSAKTKHTLAMLAKSTQEHCQKVRALWQEHK